MYFHKILVVEFFTIDRLASGALLPKRSSDMNNAAQIASSIDNKEKIPAYIASREISTLKHKAWNDSMEGRAFVAKSLLAGAQSAEISCSSWHYIIVELEDDPSRRTFYTNLRMMHFEPWEYFTSIPSFTVTSKYTCDECEAPVLVEVPPTGGPVDAATGGAVED